MTSAIHLFTTSSVDPIYASLGGPRFNVAADEIPHLYGVYSSCKDVALYLSIFVRTVEQRRNEFNLTVSSKMGKRDTRTNINDEQLCSIVREVLKTLPGAGDSYMIGAVRQRNIIVQRQRMRDVINKLVDPVSIVLIRAICIIRRVPCVPAPNSLW